MKKIFLIALLVSFSNLYSQIPDPPGCNNFYAIDLDNDGFTTFNIDYYVNTYVRNEALSLGYNLSGYNLALFPSETDYNNNTNVIGNTYVNQVALSHYCFLKLTYSGTGVSYDQATLNTNFTCHILTTVNPNLDDDSDSILNNFEDLNNDKILNNEDTDLDGTLNFKDTDDDGDGVLSVNEDYNLNGSPLDDDINTNGIPDYLDNTVFLGSESFTAKKEVKLFPNPVQNNLTISTLNSDYKSIEVLDMTGKVLAIKKVNTSSIDFSEFESGIYFVKINWVDTSINYKIIKL